MNKSRTPRPARYAILAFVALAGVAGAYVALGIGEKVSAAIFGAAAAGFYSACGTLAWKALDAFRDTLREADPLASHERHQMRSSISRERFAVVVTLLVSSLLAAAAGAFWVLVNSTTATPAETLAAVYFGFSSAAMLLPLVISLGLAYFSADEFMSRVRDLIREQRAASERLTALASEKQDLDALASDPALLRYRESTSR